MAWPQHSAAALVGVHGYERTVLPRSCPRVQRGEHNRRGRERPPRMRAADSTSWWSTTAPPTTPRRSRDGARAGRPPPVQPRDRRAVQAGSFSRVSIATTTSARSTATASTTLPSCDRLVAAMDGPARSTWCADPDSSPRLPLPRADQPPDRHPHLRVPALADRATAMSAIRRPASGCTTGARSSCSPATIRTTIPRSRRC